MGDHLVWVPHVCSVSGIRDDLDHAPIFAVKNKMSGREMCEPVIYMLNEGATQRRLYHTLAIVQFDNRQVLYNTKHQCRVISIEKLNGCLHLLIASQEKSVEGIIAMRPAED